MADCILPELYRAYQNPTALESRTVLLKVYQRILTDTSHVITTPYDRIWNRYTKQGVTDLKQPLVMTKPGLIPANYPVLLQQGHSYAPRYYPHAKQFHWKAFNPFRVEVRTSRNGRERMLFETEEQIKLATEADAFGFANSISQWKKMMVHLLFMTPDEFKKRGSWKDDGSDGINSEMVKTYFPSDTATKGHPAYQQGQSIEQNYLCYSETDNTFSPCCKQGEDCKVFQYKKDPVKEAITLIQKCLATNVHQAKAATLKGYLDEGMGSAEYAKIIGFLHDTRALIAEMVNTNTSKFNVCGNAADPAKCCFEDADCEKFMQDWGRIIGCCATCTKDGKEKCCCYNQTQAMPSELCVYINYQDHLEMQTGIPLMQSGEFINNLSKYLGNVDVEVTDLVPPGEIRIVNDKTIGIHPVQDAGLIIADYPWHELTNMRYVENWHIVVYPFAYVTVKKPT